MPKVAIIMGSVSDLETVKPAIDVLKKFDVESSASRRSNSGVYAVARNRTSCKKFYYGRIGFFAFNGADAVRYTCGLRGYQRRFERRTSCDTNPFDKISQPYEKNARL